MNDKIVAPIIRVKNRSRKLILSSLKLDTINIPNPNVIIKQIT